LSASQISRIPGRILSYWMSDELLDAFGGGRRLADMAEPRQGMATADNGRFLRLWTEVSLDRIGFGLPNRSAANASRRRWFPYNKGGSFRRWYGNQEYIVNWEDDGSELLAERPKSVIRSPQYYFNESVSWSKVGTAAPAFRYFPPGFLFDVAGTSMFTQDRHMLRALLAFANSVVAREMLRASATSMNLEVGTIAELPIRVTEDQELERVVDRLIEIYRVDWETDERSWDFESLPTLAAKEAHLQTAIAQLVERSERLVQEARQLEELVNKVFIDAYKLGSLLSSNVSTEEVALSANPVRTGISDATRARLAAAERLVHDLVSYSVGCMFGRYSLDEPGLILAIQGNTLEDYLAKVPEPSFLPDSDNVIPIVDGDWFEDDIVARFRQFLRVAFGEEHFEENLRFVTESLGVKDLRDYFVKSFYKDHVKRYKKRPIYWLFSSSKGSFNALIYMHRYTPSTVSIVLNEYLREFSAKLEASRLHHERLATGAGTPRERAAAQKEVDRLRKVLLELEEYEHDVLYPLATQQVEINLDDGVKANYPKFGAALKKVPGLEGKQ